MLSIAKVIVSYLHCSHLKVPRDVVASLLFGAVMSSDILRYAVSPQLLVIGIQMMINSSLLSELFITKF